MDTGFSKRLFWVVALFGLSIWSILSNDLVLGLDLQGGVTQRYQLQQSTSPDIAADLSAQVDTSVDTLRSRLDTYGIREMSITRQGVDEILIELPGSGKEEADTIKSLVSQVGRLEWRVVNANDLRNGVTVEDERVRLAELLSSPDIQGLGPEEIAVTGLDLDFPDVRYRWVPYSDKKLAERRNVAHLDEINIDGERLLAGVPLVAEEYYLIKFEKDASRLFTGSDILDVFPDMDRSGGRAVGIRMEPSRSEEFGNFTEDHENELMAMVLDGRISEDPATINGRLEGQWQVFSGKPGGFSEREIKTYLTIVKSGSLQLKPRLLYENTVGPSLGESSIKAGTNAAVWASVAILLFIVLYYRVHGVIAGLCLAYNLVLMAGLLMLMQATITLPGLAGLVLTVGMAVDANILVFERLREEADAAKSFREAVKLGFQKALSTILDANITTFVTAFILFKVGSGPVAGFAVVLMVGICASVFAVLVFGRTMYDVLIDRMGMGNANMMRLLGKGTTFAFMNKTRMAMRISGILVVAALFAFTTADRDKYGLDFLGGYKAQVRLAQAKTQGEIKDLVNPVFPSAQVVSVTDGTEGNRSHQFVVKVKGDGTENSDLATTYEAPIKSALSQVLLPDFVTAVRIVSNEENQSTAISATLHFEGEPDPAVAKTALGSAFSDVEVEAGGPGALHIKASLPRVGIDEPFITQRLSKSLANTTGLPKFSEPFVESTTIGSRVGTELRDSAIRAIFFSFIAIVLYIRVRFKEYSYGWAAITALAHDVCLALGAVAVVHSMGLLDIEIDLAMIAAFLTIVGYSLNDTIVLFDRVRENLPRINKPLTEVLDISINQTLARTLLTSMTTLVALTIILAFNYGRQNVLEGFSFAMIIGVLVGTYSSIFVAAPVLSMFTSKEGGAAR